MSLSRRFCAFNTVYEIVKVRKGFISPLTRYKISTIFIPCFHRKFTISDEHFFLGTIKRVMNSRLGCPIHLRNALLIHIFKIVESNAPNAFILMTLKKGPVIIFLQIA